MRILVVAIQIHLLGTFIPMSDSAASGRALVGAPVGTSVNITCTINITDNIFWSYRRLLRGLPETVYTGTRLNDKYVNKINITQRRETARSSSTLTIAGVQLVDAGLFDCRATSERQKTTMELIVYEAQCACTNTSASVRQIRCQLNYSRTSAAARISCRLNRSQGALVPITDQREAGQATYTANVDTQQFIDDDDDVVTCASHFTDESARESLEVTLWTSPTLRRARQLVTIQPMPTDQRVFTHGDVLTCTTTRDSVPTTTTTTTTTTYSWIDPTTNNLLQTGSELTLDLCRDLCLNTSDDGKCAVLVEMSVKCLVTTADRAVTTAAAAMTTFNASVFTNCTDLYSENVGKNRQLIIMASVIAGTSLSVVIVVVILTCWRCCCCLSSRKSAGRKRDYSQYEQVQPHNQERVLYTTVTLPADHNSDSAAGNNTTAFLYDC